MGRPTLDTYKLEGGPLIVCWCWHTSSLVGCCWHTSSLVGCCWHTSSLVGCLCYTTSLVGCLCYTTSLVGCLCYTTSLVVSAIQPVWLVVSAIPVWLVVAGIQAVWLVVAGIQAVRLVFAGLQAVRLVVAGIQPVWLTPFALTLAKDAHISSLPVKHLNFRIVPSCFSREALLCTLKPSGASFIFANIKFLKITDSTESSWPNIVMMLTARWGMLACILMYIYRFQGTMHQFPSMFREHERACFTLHVKMLLVVVGSCISLQTH